MKHGKFEFKDDKSGFITHSLADDSGVHTLVLGTTRRGRSMLIEAEAKRRGVCYDVVAKECEPTEEQRQAEAQREQEARGKREQRLAAVRDAYWASTDSQSSEFSALHDALKDLCERDPSVEQVRKLYNMLPADVIGEGVKWGFTDTVVGDAIFEFVRDNKADVMACVFAD